MAIHVIQINTEGTEKQRELFLHENTEDSERGNKAMTLM